MPIYCTSVEVEVMIYAENEDEARDAAEEAMRDELSENGYHHAAGAGHFLYIVKDPARLCEWANSRPYNREDDMTCLQILEAEKRLPPTIEEIEAAGQQRLIAD